MMTQKYSIKLAAALLASVGLLGAQDSFLSEEDLFNEEVNDQISVYDPLESINRYTFEFNDFVYLNLLDPIANGYTFITPDPVEEGAKNFFRNLRYPIRLTGNVLQGRWEGAWVETKRFVVNSTIGIAGIFSPADDFEGMEPIPSEEVGQALGSWGIGEGPYIVIPFFGPSNARDLLGLVGDAAVHPTRKPFSAIDSWNWEWQTAIGGTEFLVSTPKLMESYRRMKGNSIDPYSSLKNGYTQFRRAAIAE
jgi:phospholipid-binding lipoprotein MlaA